MQNEFKIESVEDEARIIQWLDDKIYEFNSSAINRYEGSLFAKVTHGPGGEIVGGIAGWTWAGVSEITLLWVDEQYRGTGIGKSLLEAAEEEIIKKGCSTILLRSYSFQAPFFYEKNGYKTVFMLDDFPKGYKQYTLVKRVG